MRMNVIGFRIPTKMKRRGEKIHYSLTRGIKKRQTRIYSKVTQIKHSSNKKQN